MWAQPTDAKLATADRAADERLVHFFEGRSYKFQKLDNGQYRTQLETNDGRSQMVFINRRTVSYGSHEVREIYSLAYSSTKAPSAEQLARLMRENAKQKFGSWEYDVDAATGTHLIYFSANVAATASDDALNEMVEYVVWVADAMEKELFGADQL